MIEAWPCPLTLWGSLSATLPQHRDIVAVTKDPNVSSFQGVSLSTSAFSSVTVNPNANDAAVHLTDWFDNNNNVDVDSIPLGRKGEAQEDRDAFQTSPSLAQLVSPSKLFSLTAR